MSQVKVRIYQLAKELDVDSKILIDHCKDLGIDAKNQLSSIEPSQADQLKARMTSPRSAPSGPKPVTAPPTLPTTINKPIKTITAPKAPPRPVPEFVEEPAVDAVEAPVEPEVAAPTVAAEAPEAFIEAPVEQPVVQAPVVPAAPPVLPSMQPKGFVDLTRRPAPKPQPPKEAPAAPPAPVPAPVAVAQAPVVPVAPVVQAPVAPAPAPAPAAPVSPPRPAMAPMQPMRPNPIRQMTNLNPQRPAGMAARPPQAAPPRPPQASAPTAPPRPPQAGGPPPRPGSAPMRPGAPGARPGSPGARSGGPGRPGAAPSKDAKKPAAPAPVKFTPEQLKAMREGKTLIDIMRDQKAAQNAALLEAQRANAGAEPAVGEEGEGGDDKKAAAKGIPGRDKRHTDRAKRAEKRKSGLNQIVIKDGHAEVIENPLHIKNRNTRAHLDRMKRRQKGTEARKGNVQLSLPITVRSLSEAVGMKVTQLLLKLKELTQSLFTINSNVEVDVAEMVALEHGVQIDIVRPKDAEDELFEKLKIEDHPEQLVPRAPIVTIMGHVDHGKTSLLDRIRKSNVVDTEAGGITQVIRAWRVDHNGRPVTFLDTPGHEAFTKMRARGANVTDIAVIVVAADSGVKPQTEEAISHAKAAGVSIVVAINKIDMPNADIKKTESQLYAQQLLPDTMGGDCQFVYTSAVTGKGIPELLDTLALVAEIKELKANPNKPAFGTCLEAYLSGDEGVMATVLVQQGTLRRGEIVLCGGTYGRVRAMYNDLGKPIEEAGPSMPVRFTGLNEVPNADDQFAVLEEMTQAREIAEKRAEKLAASNQVFIPITSLDKLSLAAKTQVTEVKIILKAEARGSVEAIRKELEKLKHDEVRARVLHAGIGAITESDVQLALTSPKDTMVIGFNVVPDDAAIKMAAQHGIPIREYNIIYNLTDDIKQALEGKLKPREEVIHLGRAVIRETFKISRTGTIAGCYVTQGTIERSAKIRVIRDGGVVYPPPDKTASLESLKRFKDDVKEVREGYDCGMKVHGYDDIKVNDVIEAYRIDQIQRTLD